jgi:hypothetical protein
MPRGTSLYGSLPEQLRDPDSFASRLREVLAVRSRYCISTSVQVDVPDASDKAVLVMVHLLDTGQPQVTVLNFSNRSIDGRIKSEHLAPGTVVIDLCTDQVIAEVDPEQSFGVSLEPHQGMALLTVPHRTNPGP